MIFHPEGEDITSLFASKTMKHLSVLANRERGVPFRVKWAKPDKVLTGPSKLNKLADELDDISRSFNLFLNRLIDVHRIEKAVF